MPASNAMLFVALSALGTLVFETLLAGLALYTVGYREYCSENWTDHRRNPDQR